MRLLKIRHVLFALTAAFCMVLCSPMSKLNMPGAGELYNDPPSPGFTAVTVHDPSVFPSGDGEFYVIGSHLAAAKTTDFIRWQQITKDWNSTPNIFYPIDNPDPSVQTMQEQIDDVMRGAKNRLGFYAGDIHRMYNERFYFYYCITSSWYCSAIGLAIADNAEGPYVTQGLIVRSGEAGDDSPDYLQISSQDKTGKWHVSLHPNCIDPQAFFDKDGKNFYMVYGSWSGGIFLLELNPDTGMLKEDSRLNTENGGYGKKLIQNNHVSIEGPYIIYSPQTEYYYLFVSYGELQANGGYNIRAFRSRNIEGPYTDALHKNMDMAVDLQISRHYEYGVKIMGSYQFNIIEGESPQRSTGYLSPGHNSVYYDSETERYFMIYHQRFANRGEYHEVRVCELFLNEDGWFAASPFRFAGGDHHSFTEKSLAGTWKVINHGNENNAAPNQSVRFEFLSNGKIRSLTAGFASSQASNNSSGTWELLDDKRSAHITINGILYKGIFLRSFDEDKNRWVQAFTALSEDGIALWGAGISLDY